MAATKKSNSRGKSPDAITLLKSDHRTVEKLFAAFEKTEDEERKSSLAQTICKLLTIHMTIEEESLYPAAHHALRDEDIVHEAEVEHSSAKVLVSEVEGMSADDEKFDATVKVLSEYIKHHVKEEETEMFPKLKRARMDLQDLGATMAARREQLMMKVGVDEAEVEALIAPKSRAKSSKSQSGRGGARASSRRISSRSARSERSTGATAR